MNTKIIDFINQMRDLTGEAFQYEIEYWAHSSGNEKLTHKIYSSLPGFESIKKESEQELIDVFNILNNQITALMRARELSIRANTKQLNSPYADLL